MSWMQEKVLIFVLNLLKIFRFFFFFFLISNKDIYSRTLPYAEKHKAERKIQRERKRKKKKKGKDTNYTGES